ncbi:ABC transporter permease, partial [Alphaproteobacteria bacterium]|nr:ABC transporter permease [Alphaproteobacteria bacterium]
INYMKNFFSLLAPIYSPRAWIYIAHREIIMSHKRTFLGPFWLVINVVVFSCALGAVYSGIFNVSFFSYLAYITTGFIGWMWMASILTNSGTIFVQYTNIVKNYPLNKSLILWSKTMYNQIVFLYQVPIVLLFYFLGTLEFSTNNLYIIPSLFIVFSFNISFSTILSFLCVRFRDIQKLISSSIIVIMVTTPIFWEPSMVTGLRKLIYLLNPIFYMIEIIRLPLLGKDPNFFYYVISLTITIVIFCIACFIYNKYNKILVFRL